MKNIYRLLLTVALMLPLTAAAQNSPQYSRPQSQYGLNVFETTKIDTTSFDGFEVFWGGAFTQQFQMLEHSNEAAPVIVDGVNTTAIPELGGGFNLATANLNLDAQLADGIRVSLTTYLSSRHHSEAWVKGGFVQIDKVPMLKSPALDAIFKYMTLRLGHFEINYGDAHFRRTDNGNAIYNPFVGNYIMDSFTTEIGGEVYVQSNGLLGMVGITGGEIRGTVLQPDDRAPSIYGKVGFDRQLSEDLRLRLTGSAYTTAKSVSNTLYGGDRAGSRYYEVMGLGFTSGRINPGFRDDVTSFMINPFVQFHGLEVFGVVEFSEGSAQNEATDRSVRQYAVEALYRFAPRDQLYVGGRYNTVSGDIGGANGDVTVDRIQAGGGWFVTPNVLMKVEYVQQTFDGFAPTDKCYEGKFNGLMVEGVIAF